MCQIFAVDKHTCVFVFEPNNFFLKLLCKSLPVLCGDFVKMCYNLIWNFEWIPPRDELQSTYILDEYYYTFESELTIFFLQWMNKKDFALNKGIETDDTKNYRVIKI